MEPLCQQRHHRNFLGEKCVFSRPNFSTPRHLEKGRERASRHFENNVPVLEREESLKGKPSHLFRRKAISIKRKNDCNNGEVGAGSETAAQTHKALLLHVWKRSSYTCNCDCSIINIGTYLAEAMVPLAQSTHPSPSAPPPLPLLPCPSPFLQLSADDH